MKGVREVRGVSMSRARLKRHSRFNADQVSAVRWVDGGAAIAFLPPDKQRWLQRCRHDLSSGKTEQMSDAPLSPCWHHLRIGGLS